MQVTHLSERIEPPGETLAPTPGVARTLGLLTEVVTAATVADDAQQDFKQVIESELLCFFLTAVVARGLFI